jgi:membrane glycosyltransferase
VRPAIRAARRALLDRALTDGPGALDLTARRRLLADPQLVTELHERVWALADRRRAARWIDLPDGDT